MEKLKNYGLWVALASIVLMALQDLGLNVSPERYQLYVDGLLTILIVLGVVSNPKEGKWFRDEK